MEMFLLDTNAYFNLLKYTVLKKNSEEADYAAEIERLKRGKCFISEISQMEIVSVVGRLARGKSSGREKCQYVISEDGEVCNHFHYISGIKPMKKRLVHEWLKLIEETSDGRSAVLSVSVLPFCVQVLGEAREIIKYSTVHNFGSLDAVIAATLKTELKKAEMKSMQMVTSDKGLKACLGKCNLPYWDAFSKKQANISCS